MTVAYQLLVKTIILGKPLGKTAITVRLIDLVLVVIVWNMLKNQENQKAKNCLSPKNYLNQEYQKAKN